MGAEGMTTVGTAWVLEKAGEPLAERPLELGAPGPGEATIEVLACGLCHTDLGFADGGVTPNKGLPIVLGHEVVGRVIAVGEGAEKLSGRKVLVPAVMPCGVCDLCRGGRGNACTSQKMPGNDIDGGFATHLVAPAAALVPVDHFEGDALLHLSVVADAVSTAYQAIERADMHASHLAVIVGAGGVGGFLAQLARARGAHVIACDISSDRLELVRAHGARHVIDVTGRKPRDVRREIAGLAREWGVPTLRWRIFECSGTTAGQELSFGLLQRAATLVLVGFTPQKVTLRLSNLMAFDATVHGTWGCALEHYPTVLDFIHRGEVVLDPFVEYAPLSAINETLDALRNHELERRIIFRP